MTYSKIGTFRPMLWIGLIVLAMVALSACSTPADPVPAAPEGGEQNAPAASLDKTQWTLVSINGEAVVEGVTATLAFEGGKVSGKGGCNSYGGSAKIEGNTITFSEVMSTLMACEESVMNVEQAFMGVLQGSATYSVAGSNLTLTGADGTVLVLSKQ